MSDNYTPTDLLTEARRYLRQQADLYGNTLIREAEAIDAVPPAPEQAIEKKELEPMPKKSAVKSTAPAAAAVQNDAPWMKSASLNDLRTAICECQNCSLGATRTKFVFGVGNQNASLLVIGEAPGEDEDLQGEPFVGRAGQLLNKILEAVQFKREEVYIANILKCRPPKNRRPLPSEVERCEPYLAKQIALIQPKIILCLGLTAAQTLLKTEASLTELRAKEHEYCGTPVVVTYHPAALLRNPNWKRPTWEDVQKLRERHDALVRG